MKKIVLAALNAKYIHSNLALRYLSRFQDNHKKHHLITREFTINQRPDFIVEETVSSALAALRSAMKAKPSCRKTLPLTSCREGRENWSLQNFWSIGTVVCLLLWRKLAA